MGMIITFKKKWVKVPRQLLDQLGGADINDVAIAGTRTLCALFLKQPIKRLS